MPTRIQQRRDASATWTSVNPILAAGEIGYETDTRRFKIGDGSTAWNVLPYHTSGVSSVFTASAAGLVPAAGAGAPDRVLRADGAWGTATGSSPTLNEATLFGRLATGAGAGTSLSGSQSRELLSRGRVVVPLLDRYPNIPTDGTDAYAALKAALDTEWGADGSLAAGKVIVLDKPGAVIGLNSGAINRPGIVVPSGATLDLGQTIIRRLWAGNTSMSGALIHLGPVTGTTIARNIHLIGGILDRAGTYAGRALQARLVDGLVIDRTVVSVFQPGSQGISLHKCSNAQLYGTQAISAKTSNGDTALRFTGCRQVLVLGGFFDCNDNSIDTSHVAPGADDEIGNDGIIIIGAVCYSKDISAFGCGLVPNERGAAAGLGGVTVIGGRCVATGVLGPGFQDAFIRLANCSGTTPRRKVLTHTFQGVIARGEEPAELGGTVYLRKSGVFVDAEALPVITTKSVAQATADYDATTGAKTLRLREVVIPNDAGNTAWVEGDGVTSFATLWASRRAGPYSGSSPVFNFGPVEGRFQDCVIGGTSQHVFLVRHPQARITVTGGEYYGTSALNPGYSIVYCDQYGTSSPEGTQVVVEGARIVAGSGSTAPLIIASEGVRLILRRCVIEGVQAGQIAVQSRGTATLEMEDCQIIAAPGVTTAIGIDPQSSVPARIEGCSISGGTLFSATLDTRDVVLQCLDDGVAVADQTMIDGGGA